MGQIMKNIFLTNYSNTKFLDKIKESLKSCSSFSFSVSFIKKAGLILLEKEIEDALKRGCKGRIITSTYQNFTDIPSLELFLSWMKTYPKFICHLDYQCFGDNGFHSKGYLFEYNDSCEFIVGSTNITRFALLKNVEWNVSLYSKDYFDSLNDAYKEFDELWNKTLLLDEELIKKYKILIDYAIEKWDMDYVDGSSNKIRPNAMQRKALKELRRYRDQGVKKSLIIAATGSGKTYLSAFDANNFDAKRLLFIVHRDTILNDAMKTFEKVFGSKRSYGLYTGDNQNLDADFIFASNIMVSKHLDEFQDTEFDYIIIDECHHSVADSYKKIIEYFKPEFLLGLTATPERMDNEDVFEMFDTNVPFELRLRDAIINKLVVPFHYYGIRDNLVDYSSQEKGVIAKEISKSDNIDFIVKEIEAKRATEIKGKLKCIAFCTSIHHAQTMAELFNDAGYSARALLGENNLGERIRTFNDLQDDDNDLEIICAVDILNEGVDIPSINMVLFLRPTESSTIFLQQLGRGLRNYPNKEYLTVLDFIGNNYDRSVQIAMALGTLGVNAGIEKAYLREMVATNFISLDIPGVVINIDQLAREEVLEYLDKTNFNVRKFLEKDYMNFKAYLKTCYYPSHMDYLNSDVAPDLIRFMKAKIGKKNMSYYSFLKKIGEEDIPLFNDQEEYLINQISDLLPLTRVDEYIIIKQMISSNYDASQLIGFNRKVSDKTLDNAYYYLENDGIVKNLRLNINIISEQLKEYLSDLIEYGLTKYSIDFGDFNSKYKLYANYSNDQIAKELLLKGTMHFKSSGIYADKNEEGTIYLTIDLNKNERLSKKYLFKDGFKSESIFIWESQKDTTFTNEKGKMLLNSKKIHLFIRKVKEEDGITMPFTYFGEGKLINPRNSTVMDDKGVHNTLLFDILLTNSVKKELHFDFEIPEKEVN